MYLSGSIFIAIKAALVVGNILLQNLLYSASDADSLSKLIIRPHFHLSSQPNGAYHSESRRLDSFFLFLLPFLLSVAEFALGIVLGIKANKMYYNHCIRTAKQAKAEASGEAELEAALRKKGGVNMFWPSSC